MSLMSNLFVGQSGLQTSHNALNTTAHNLANVDTKGYTRQQVSQGTRAYQTLEVKNNGIGPKQVGTGVSYNNCKQVRSEFLDSSYRREQGRLAFYDVSKKALEEIPAHIYNRSRPHNPRRRHTSRSKDRGRTN